MRSLRHFVAAALILCASTTARAAEPSHTLVIAVPYVPASYDPDAFVAGGLQASNNCYDQILNVAVKHEDGKILVDNTKMDLGLADRVTVSPDGTTFRFHIRPNVKSAAGNVFSTKDVQFTWDRTKAIGANSGFINKLIGLKDIQVVNDQEFDVILAQPSRILMLIAVMTPYDSTEVRKHVTADDPWGKEWLSHNTAGFGPYNLQSSKPGEGAVFTYNTNYWGGKPYFDRIVYREVASAATRATLIRAKQVQWADEMPLAQVAQLERDPNVHVQEQMAFGEAMLRMNPKFKPFDDIRVRQAVFYALDYDAIQRIVFLGKGERTRSMAPKQLIGSFDANPVTGRDVAKARTLLAEAGHPDGIDVELIYSSNWWWEEPLAVQARNSLAEAGIRVSLKQVSPQEIAARRANKVADLPFFTHLSFTGHAPTSPMCWR